MKTAAVLAVAAAVLFAAAGAWWWFAGTVAVAVAVWGADVRVNPRAACLWCGGSGRSRWSRGKAWDHCPHCKGHRGERLRVGARFVNPKLKGSK